MNVKGWRHELGVHGHAGGAKADARVGVACLYMPLSSPRVALPGPSCPCSVHSAINQSFDFVNRLFSIRRSVMARRRSPMRENVDLVGEAGPEVHVRTPRRSAVDESEGPHGAARCRAGTDARRGLRGSQHPARRGKGRDDPGNGPLLLRHNGRPVHRAVSSGGGAKPSNDSLVRCCRRNPCGDSGRQPTTRATVHSRWSSSHSQTTARRSAPRSPATPDDSGRRNWTYCRGFSWAMASTPRGVAAGDDHPHDGRDLSVPPH